MTGYTSTYPLRLPNSLKSAVQELNKSEGTSLNQFVVLAVAEKVAAMKAFEFFTARQARTDWDAFDRILNRPGGEVPRQGDGG